MLLKNIAIKNFKLCAEVSFNLRDNLTVFLGKNGSGKTSVLQAINLLSEYSPSRRMDYYFESEINKKHYDETSVIAEIEYEGETYQYKLTLYFEKDSVDNKPIRHRSELYFPKKKKLMDYSDPKFIYSQASFGFHNDLESLVKDDKSDYAIMYKVVKFLVDFQYFSSNAFLGSSELDTMIEASPKSYRNRSNDNFRFISQLHELYKNEPKKFRAYKKMVTIIGSGLVQDITFEPIELPKTKVKTYRGGHLTTIDEKRDMVVPLFHINGNILYDNQLSEGTFRTLALTFFVLTSNSTVLMVEEPELSVHYELLADLVELIQNEASKRQIIMTTHSDKIVSKLNLDDISIVENSSTDGIKVMDIKSKLGADNFNAIQKYINEGGNLGEYLLS